MMLDDRATMCGDDVGECDELEPDPLGGKVGFKLAP